MTRAVKGALAGGLKVREVIATAEGVRVIADDGAATKPAGNSFDKVLDQ